MLNGEQKNPSIAAEDSALYWTHDSPLLQYMGVTPNKAMWATNTVFVTPPGWWHSHHNESDQDAYVFPVQDAGLHSYIRTFDIQFVR